MSRQQLLFKLLEKAQKGNQYIYTQLYEMTKSSSPPATIKRMQILQMGSCKINPPSQKDKEQPIFQKQNSVNNRRVLVLQKVKSLSKNKQIDRSNTQKQNLNNKIKSQLGYQSVTQSVDPKSVETAQTEAESPLRHGFTTKKTLCLSESTRNSNIKKQLDCNVNMIKSEKNCIFKSIQFQSQSARNDYHQNLKRRITNNSRIRKQSQSSFCKEDQKKTKMLFRKQLNKNYQRAFEPPPKISAKSYIIYQIADQGQKMGKQNIKVHSAFNSKVRTQIASLTKIMTCILAIEICQRLNLNPNSQEIKIGKFQSSIGGTTANIQIDDIYTLHDLLHGLMLPSGNDASLAIAVWGGKKLIQHKQTMEGQLIHPKKMKKQCYERFIQQMNAKAQVLGMTKTNYANSHGLANLLNRSCAHDVALLCHHSMKNKYFCKIVSCRQYRIKIKVQAKIKIQNSKQQQTKPKPISKITNDEEQQYSDLDSQTCSQASDHLHEECKNEMELLEKSQSTVELPKVEYKIAISNRDVQWENTHKLLHKNPTEYLGIKTGVTTSAGPCLSSCILTPCGRKVYIVVLNCKKLQMRFKQTQVLRKWFYKKQGIKKTSKETKSQMQISDKQQQQFGDQSTNANANQD